MIYPKQNHSVAPGMGPGPPARIFGSCRDPAGSGRYRGASAATMHTLVDQRMQHDNAPVARRSSFAMRKSGVESPSAPPVGLTFRTSPAGSLVDLLAGPSALLKASRVRAETSVMTIPRTTRPTPARLTRSGK